MDNSIYSKTSEIARTESRQLPKLAARYVKQVEQYTGSLLYLTDKDKLRLLTLRAWEMKYKVSLKFILQTLLPFWQKWLRGKTKRISKGLGVRVSSLTGKKSESLLQDAIKRTYPDNENVLVWMSERREEIIQAELERMRSKPRIKSLLKFTSPDKYFRHYQHKIQEEALLREQIEMKMRKYPYRYNPFLPQTCYIRLEEER